MCHHHKVALNLKPNDVINDVVALSMIELRATLRTAVQMLHSRHSGSLHQTSQIKHAI